MMFVNHNKKEERGVTLLIAFLAMTMCFSLATGIFTLLYSEFRLAAQESDSIKAFYAANTGLECARYWDNVRANPATSAQNYRAFQVANLASRPIRCNADSNGGNNLSVSQSGGNANRTLRFVMNTAFGCADINITKTTAAQERITKILSRGRVRAGANCSVTDRVVERALEFTYTERLPSN